MNRRLTIGLIIAAVAGMCFTFPSAGSALDVLIITNKDVPVDSISKDDLKKIFTGKKTQWSNNEKIRFVDLDKKEVHKAFLRQFVRKTPEQYSRYWKKQVFTGRNKKPRSFRSEGDVVDYVAATDGAIGYVSTGSVTDNVKVLKVN